MKIGLTPVIFKIVIECVFSDQNCILLTQLNEKCIKQRQGPAACGSEHSEHLNLDQSSPCDLAEVSHCMCPCVRCL